MSAYLVDSVVVLWLFRRGHRYSQINKPVVGFMPVYGAEVSEVEGEPTFFRLRDGFNNSVVDHIFVASTPREKAICTSATMLRRACLYAMGAQKSFVDIVRFEAK